MGLQTIITLNHDEWGHIRDDPEGFAKAVLAVLNYAPPKEDHEIFPGVRRVATNHHTEAIECYFEGRAVSVSRDT